MTKIYTDVSKQTVLRKIGNVTNNFGLVHKVTDDLKSYGIDVLLGGGWAEELLEVIPRRTHKDIDLFYVGSDFGNIKTQMKKLNKTYRQDGHKLTFKEENIGVEIVLIEKAGNNYFTNFHHKGEQRKVNWPEPLSEMSSANIKCMSRKCLCFRRAMDKYIKGKVILSEK